TVEREQHTERAIALFSQVVTLFDPIRLHAWANLGLTLPTLKVIVLIRAEPGAPSGVIASRLGVTPSTVTGLVDRLVNQGLVRRDEDPRDRRLVRNFLTEAGERTVGDLERQAREVIGDLLSELTDAQLVRLVEGLDDVIAVARRRAVAVPAAATI
ncbi:MAG TPA: MarR family transcriptional regulator, partial [Dehalococcoidia bacterium]